MMYPRGKRNLNITPEE